MDYFFLIKLNDQDGNLEDLKQSINGFGADLRYLEIDEDRQGLIGIASFDQSKTTEDGDTFFNRVRMLVRDINNLPIDRAEIGELEPADLPSDMPAIWARASFGKVLLGFQPEGSPDPNEDDNPYVILSTSTQRTLTGGIGGKK
jgi:hypothetical protein